VTTAKDESLSMRIASIFAAANVPCAAGVIHLLGNPGVTSDAG
jgi:hypothetical protein